MPHVHHVHRHGRRQWDEIVNGAKGILDEANPFQKKTPATIYKTVYTTMHPTFTGSIAGYTTLGSDGSTATNDSSDENTSADPNQTTTDDTAQPTSTSETSQPSSTVPSSVSSPDSSVALPTTLVTQTGSSSSANLESITASSTSSSAAATSTSSSDSSGSSGGAKAGIALGVLAAILAVFLLVWLVSKKRRKQDDRQHLEEDEKINGPFAEARSSVNTTRTTPNAPRISLRPVTQFLPNLDKRTSKGANIALSASPSSPMRSPGQSVWERPMTAETSGGVNNPFGDHAERVVTPDSEAAMQATPTTPHSPASVTASTTSSPSSSPTGPGSLDRAADGAVVAGLAATAAGAVAAASLTRKASMRKDGPKEIDLTVAKKGPSMSPIPPSPATTEFSVHSAVSGQSSAQSQGAAAIAAAGGPSNSTVHRVQLDFAPTLEDELELKAGQLVRLLHEYDDGWALCIRLDRSKQGVVPRTCLSARPVKPRPQQHGPRPGPPVNPQGPGNLSPGPQGRPPMGPGGQPRPMSPANRAMPPADPSMSPAGRPQSPAGRPMSPYRPQSPADVRSQSPGPQQRSQSPSGMNRRNSPSTPSPLNPQQQQHQIERKPVPGQAY